MYSLTALVIAVCFAHPLISYTFIEPYINGNTYLSFVSPINSHASMIIIFMLCLVFVLPLILAPVYKKYPVKQTSLYLSGANSGDDESFISANDKRQTVDLRNFYLKDLFGEERWYKPAFYLTVVLLCLFSANIALRCFGAVLSF
jgi:hypothetical protein